MYESTRMKIRVKLRMHMKNDQGPTSFCLMRTPLVLSRPDCTVNKAGCK